MLAANRCKTKLKKQFCDNINRKTQNRNKFNKNQSVGAICGDSGELVGANSPLEFPRVGSIFVALIISQGETLYQLV